MFFTLTLFIHKYHMFSHIIFEINLVNIVILALF